jgi:chromatin assembly factor 1 subunit A
MKKEFSFLEKKKKEEEKGAGKKIIKSEDKNWTKEDQDGYYHPQKEQLKVSSFKVLIITFSLGKRICLNELLCNILFFVKVTKLAPTVRTEFNADRRTNLDDLLNGINNPMSEVSSLFHFKGNGGRTSGATFPMKKNFAGVKVVGESITVLHYLNNFRKCKVLLDVDDCGAVALTNEEVRMIFRESHRRSRSKLLQFWDNRRPPYWGTWGKTSHSVRPRRPFGKEVCIKQKLDE